MLEQSGIIRETSLKCPIVEVVQEKHKIPLIKRLVIKVGFKEHLKEGKKESGEDS